MKKGIFWLIEGRFVCVSVECDVDGTATEPARYSSKSGENFNHRFEWEKLPRSVTHGDPFDYYPRGRVEIKDGKATLWIAPSLNGEEIINKIKEQFELVFGEIKFEVKVDSSPHYDPEIESTYLRARKIYEEHRELFERLKDR